MGHSAAYNALARLMRAHIDAGQTGDSGELSRGEFTRLLLGGTAGAVLAPALTTGTAWARGRERIAIVGAGIGGLACAMGLRDAGVAATVFESSNRIGGRIHSERSYWDQGQHTEWCGSMIDSKHLTMHALAKRFGLPLVDSYATLKRGARDTSYFSGRYYPMTQADRDFTPVFKILEAQLAQTGPTVTYDVNNRFARELDGISMLQWVDKYVPGASNSQFGKLILDALGNEEGVDPSQQSSLNLVQMLGVQYNYDMRGGEMNVLGYSDQRYYIAGGNQRLPLAIAAWLPAGSVKLQHRLIAIRKLPGGTYELRFTTPKGEVKQIFDRVVLGLSFLGLRGVDYASAGFNAHKKQAIENLGYGMHTKLQVQFNGRPWTEKGPWPYPTTGQIWTDLGFQNSVDFSLSQAGRDGIIERFTGMTAGLIDTPQIPYAHAGEDPAVERHVRKFFDQLDQIWPGVSKHWNGKAAFGNAQADPNIQASYSCWLVGQFTTIAGYEQVRQGNVHFCGEHTSVEHQGFMEGGASSGIRAAGEILADYGIKSRSA